MSIVEQTLDLESLNTWRDRLIEKLEAERKHWARMHAYYACEQGFPVYADSTLKDAAKRLMKVSMTNVAEMVVEAPLDRMIPTGCRTAAAGDEIGDAVGDRIWRGNNLTAKATLTFEESLSMGMGYMLVGDINPDTGVPLITVEDPRECTVITDPATGRVLAGMKIYQDGENDYLYLYLPGTERGTVHRAQRPSDWRPEPNLVERNKLSSSALSGWEWVGHDNLRTRRVPLVAFPNRPDAAGRPQAEFERHVGLIDRITYLTLQRLEVTTLQAFRQRALKGGPTRDPETGEPIDWEDIFEAGPGAIWHLPETAELWESGAVDIRPMIEGEKHDFRTLAGVTGTPLFYITPEASEGSAEGAALAKEKLIFKTKRHISVATASMKQVLSISFEVLGDDERAQIADIDVLWMPPERFSLSETADAASKAMAGGLSRRAVLRDIWRKTPTEIREIEDDLAAEALLGLGIEGVAELVTGAAGPAGQPPTGG